MYLPATSFYNLLSRKDKTMPPTTEQSEDLNRPHDHEVLYKMSTGDKVWTRLGGTSDLGIAQHWCAQAKYADFNVMFDAAEIVLLNNKHGIMLTHRQDGEDLYEDQIVWQAFNASDYPQTETPAKPKRKRKSKAALVAVTPTAVVESEPMVLETPEGTIGVVA
jgi:hypothetical protein